MFVQRSLFERFQQAAESDGDEEEEDHKCHEAKNVKSRALSMSS